MEPTINVVRLLESIANEAWHEDNRLLTLMETIQILKERGYHELDYTVNLPPDDVVLREAYEDLDRERHAYLKPSCLMN